MYQNLKSCQLCEKCFPFFGDMKLFSTKDGGTFNYFEYQDNRALLARAGQACRLCNMLAAAFDAADKTLQIGDVEEAASPVSEKLLIMYRPGSSGMFIRLISVTGRKRAILRYRPLEDMPELERFIKPVAPYTKSEESSDIIRAWIRECHTGHHACIALRDARIKTRNLPTRLLYVGQGKSPDRITLCDSAHLDPTVQYATLSHCWGTSLPVKLTSDNMEAFLEGVSIAHLPKTFRQAVELTSALSLQYLWIDALCILQDSKADWERECSKMTAVYSGALVNIAASAAVDSDGGLFASRDPLAITPCVISASNTALNWQNELCAVWIEESSRRPVADAPLNKRGWVLQERLLAPRTVHCTATKIFWECPQLLASEIDPLGCIERLDRIERHGDFGLTKGWAMSPSSYNTPVNQQSTECFKKWNTAVKLYSSGKLTYGSDKLVAIAGIARYMHTLWPDPSTKYLAGLWSYELVFSLLWYRIEPATSALSSCPKQYRAPTWSWAAVDGEVGFYYTLNHRDKQLAIIVEEKTYPTGDVFGAVNGGYIRIKGPLCAAVIKGRGEYHKTLIYLESTEEDIVIGYLYFDHDGFEQCESTELDRIYLFSVVGAHMDSNIPYIQGLALLPSGDQRGQYTRIGMFDATTHEHDESNCVDQPEHAAERLQRAFGKSRPEESLYLESHNDNTFMIEII